MFPLHLMTCQLSNEIEVCSILHRLHDCGLELVETVAAATRVAMLPAATSDSSAPRIVLLDGGLHLRASVFARTGYPRTYTQSSFFGFIFF